jgi:hypothetical protein
MGLSFHVVRTGEKTEIKEVEVYGRKDNIEVVTRHRTGISIITLSHEDVMQMRHEMDEWLAEKKTTSVRDLTS